MTDGPTSTPAKMKSSKSTSDLHARFCRNQLIGAREETRILVETCLDLTRLKVVLDDDTDLDELLYESGLVLKNITFSSGFNLFIVSEEKRCLTLMTKTGASRELLPLAAGSSLVADVAMSKECARLVGADAAAAVSPRSRESVPGAAMAVPLVRPDGVCHAVFELVRTEEEPYDDNSLYATVAICLWAASAVHQCRETRRVRQELAFHDQLTRLLTDYFCEVRSFEDTLTDMLDMAKSRLGARRALFYVVEREGDGELSATGWEEGWPGRRLLAKKKLKTNLSVDQTPAALAARSAETLNLADATRDPRFGPSVDAATGELVRAVLAAPVLDKCGVCGVVQLYNKKGLGGFSIADEELFGMFLNYCSLLIHHYKVETSKEYKKSLSLVYKEIMALHLRSCPHNYDELMRTNGVVPPPPDFYSSNFYIGGSTEHEMAGLAVLMLVDVMGEHSVVRSSLVDFVLTVLKCYRKNPYHNAVHAFTFTHTMYLLLLANRSRFSKAECVGFILSGLCHDLDHPGFNNNYLALVGHPLAKMYKSSILEHHHYNLAHQCIQTKKLLEKMPPDLQEQIMAEIKYDILCTDLAFYFQIRAQFAPIVSERAFDWGNDTHKKFVKGLMMTTSDLSGNCKPIPILKQITLSVYEEFYNQGDREREMGLVPLSMMDRRRAANQPAEQLQFLSVVVMPCLLLLQSVCLGISEWIDNCRRSMDGWREELDNKTRSKAPSVEDENSLRVIAPNRHKGSVGILIDQ